MTQLPLQYDLLLKKPDLHPFQIPSIKAALLTVCSNPILHQNPALLAKVITSLSLLTNQTPLLLKTKQSFASFHLKKGVEFPVLCTVRRHSLWITYFYLLFWMQLHNPGSIRNGYMSGFTMNRKLEVGEMTGNFQLVVEPASSSAELKQFLFSYWLLPWNRSA